MLAVMVALQRVERERHYVADVLVGAGLGMKIYICRWYGGSFRDGVVLEERVLAVWKSEGVDKESRNSIRRSGSRGD